MMRPGLSKMSISWLLVVAATATCFCWSRAAADQTQCGPCKCVHVDGGNQANCSRTGLGAVPSNLSENIKVLLFDNNNYKLGVLTATTFSGSGLVNLRKISMRSCSIREVDKEVFVGLSELWLVDLSNNEIKRLDAALFVATPRLRYFHANNNSIQQLEDNLFSNLFELQTVELNDNKLSAIGDRAFFNLTKLNTLKLRNNQLVRLNPSTFQAPGMSAHFSSFELHNNPWDCDCQLRGFFKFAKNFITTPTYCDKPEHLRLESWQKLHPEQLACGPTIVWPEQNDRVTPDSEQVTLNCQVIGDPTPKMYWTIGGLILENDTRHSPNGEPKYTIYISGNTTAWCNLTIWNFSSSDEGQYTCVAKNEAVIVERNVSVEIPPPSNGNLGNKWVFWLCVIAGLVCVLIFILLVCFLCCGRGKHFLTEKASNSTVTSNGNATPEQQKTLLTAVNPVQKPPRIYDSSAQSEDGGTELHELNRNLLDDNYGHAGRSLAGDSMEDRRSTNTVEPLSSCNSQENLLMREPARVVARSLHTPDLLAFSGHLPPVSPAYSALSNDGTAGDYDTMSRFPRFYSPVRSPIYQQRPSPARTYSPTYETLLYGRTRSPFGAVAPVVTHHAGYVTMPRRARVPSWSSAPTPSLDEAAFDVEPVYDRLGPRTTADGSSVLSLPRRLAAESATPGANLRNRPLPPAPLYASHTLPHKSKLSQDAFLSIRENEEPHFHPVVREPASEGAAGASGGGVVKPLPLQYSPNRGEPPLAATPDQRRPPSWAPPESGTLRGPSSGDLPAAGKAKVPPKPPPKPGKSGPLFEDEGEDGTEV